MPPKGRGGGSSANDQQIPAPPPADEHPAIVQNALEILRDKNATAGAVGDALARLGTLLCVKESTVLIVRQGGAAWVANALRKFPDEAIVCMPACAILMGLAANHELAIQVGNAAVADVANVLRSYSAKDDNDSKIVLPVAAAGLMAMTAHDSVRARLQGKGVGIDVLKTLLKYRDINTIYIPCIGVLFALSIEQDERQELLAYQEEGSSSGAASAGGPGGIFISVMLDVLKNDHLTIEAHAYAAGCLLNTSGIPAPSQVLSMPEVVPVVVSRARGCTNGALLAHTCGILANAAKESQTCAEIVAAGGVPVVLAAFDIQPISPEVLQYAAMCLSNLTTNQDAVKVVLEAGGAEVMGKFWKLFGLSPLVVPFASIVARLCASSPEARFALARCVGYAAASLKGLPVAQGKEQTVVMGALVNLLFDCDSNRARASSENVQTLVIDTMKRLPTHKDVQRAGLGVLRQLLLSEVVRKEVEFGDVRERVGAIERLFGEDPVVKEAIDAVKEVLG